MARKQERKQQKKRKKDEHKAKKHAERSRYPRIVIHADGEDPAFMAEVKRIAENFDFDSNDCCDKDDRDMYRVYRQVGIEGLRMYAASPEANERRRMMGLSAEDFGAVLFAPLLRHLGHWIFERLPDQYRRDPLPFYYYHISPQAKRLEITFEFLPRTKSPNGTIYSSPLEPTIQIGGTACKVGFFRHPLEQACKRMAVTLPITYFEFQRCFRYFRHCIYFEQVALKDQELGMRLYAPCLHQTLRDIYLKDVAGIDPSGVSGERYHHVLGYCPLTIYKRYVVAKTFLLPGYRNTPEAELFDSAPVAKKERDRMRSLTADLTYEQILNANAVEPIRFFHQNGCPQVVEMDRPVLDFSR